MHHARAQLEFLDAALHGGLERLTATGIRSGRGRAAHVDGRHVVAAHLGPFVFHLSLRLGALHTGRLGLVLHAWHACT